MFFHLSLLSSLLLILLTPSPPDLLLFTVGVIRHGGAPSQSLITSVMKDRKKDKLL